MSLSTLATIVETSEANAPIRARKMKLTPVCSRCGGTGHYSFNGSNSTCYRCAGAKCDPVNEKTLPVVIENAKRAVKEGELSAYLDRLAAEKEIKENSNKVFTTWKASTAAKGNPSHMVDDKDCTPEQLACRKANARIAEAYTAWQDTKMFGSPETKRRDALRGFFEVIETTNKELAK